MIQSMKKNTRKHKRIIVVHCQDALPHAHTQAQTNINTFFSLSSQTSRQLQIFIFHHLLKRREDTKGQIQITRKGVNYSFYSPETRDRKKIKPLTELFKRNDYLLLNNEVFEIDKMLAIV